MGKKATLVTREILKDVDIASYYLDAQGVLARSLPRETEYAGLGSLRFKCAFVPDRPCGLDCPLFHVDVLNESEFTGQYRRGPFPGGPQPIYKEKRRAMARLLCAPQERNFDLGTWEPEKENTNEEESNG